MSSIDNRIVILTFDNKDFEKNVQTSMNTLDKLKNNLDLSQSSKGLTALAASAKSFDLGPMGRAIESIKDRFSSLGIVGMTVLQNLTNTAVDFGKRLINAAIGPLTSGGWKRALDIEQATFQMEGLLGKTEGGAEKIKAIMQEVQESVKGTAFGANEAARVASQLVATGVEDAQQMRKYLDGVAGAAAMTGGAYDEIGHIFTTVAGQGKLMGEQLNQFAYRGLNIAATLSRQMGITEAEFRDLVRKGKISFDQFAEGMAIAFGEQATKANETFTGSLANMRAALARIGQDVATPALKYLRDLFNSLRLLIDAVHERLKPFIETLNNRLTKAAKNATEFIDDLTEALGGVSARMKKEMDGAAESTEDAASSISQSAEEIEDAARRVLAGEFGNGEERRQQLEALGYSYEEVQNKVNELLGCEYRYDVETKEFTATTKEAAKETENFAVHTQTLSQALGSEIFSNFYQVILNIKSAIEQFSSAIKKSFLKVFNERNGEQILILIRNISDAFLGFTDSLKLNESEQSGLQAIFEGVFGILNKILKGILKGVELFFKFATIISNARNAVFGFIGDLVNFNGEIDETSRRSRFIAALSGVFTKLGEAIGGFKDKFVEIIGRIQNTSGFIKLKDTLQQLWGILKEIGGKIFDTVIEKMNKFAESDLNFDWMDGIVDFAGKAAGKLADFIGWIINAIPKVKEFFASIKDGTNEGPLGKFVDFFIKAKDAVVGFFKGLTGGEGGEVNLFSAVKEIFQSALNNIGQFFSDLNTSGFVEGFKKFIGNVVKSAGEIDIEEAIEFLKKIGKLIAEIVGFIALIKLTKSLTNFFNGLGGFFNDVTGLKSIANVEKTKLILLAIAEIVGALYVISKIPSEDLKRSVIALGVILGGVMVALAIINKLPFDEAKMKAFAISMAGLGTGLLALSLACKVLATFSWGEFLSAAGKLAILIGELVIAAKLAGNVKSAAAFMGLAVAVNLLVPALAILGHMKWKTITKGATAIGIVALELGVASRIAGSVKAAAAFMGLALAVDLIVPALAILGKMKWSTIKQGAIALGIIVLELSAACRIAASENAGKGALAMLAMVVPIAAVIAGIKILGEMPREQLLKGAVALGSIIAAIGVSLALAKNSTGSFKSLLAMAGILAVAIGGLYILKDTPWQTLLAGGAALSMVVLSVSAALKSAEGVKANVGGFLAAMIPLGVAIGGLWVLRDTPWQTLLAGGAALSMVMLSIGAALRIAGDAQPLAASALLLVSVAVIPVCIGLKQIAGFDWQNILGAATGLSEVILAISIAMRFMAGLNPVVAIVAAAGLGAAIDIVLGFVVGFTAILGKIDEWRNGGLLESVQKGKEILEVVGQAIGGFIGGIGEGITGTLPTMADNLSEFAERLTPFFETMKGFGSDIASTISTLAGALLEITGAEFLDGIVSFISGESSLEQFGHELEAFGPALKNFWLNCKSIKDGDLTGASQAMKDVAVAAGQIPNEGGLLAELVGDNTLADFGPELEAFGPALKNFWLNCKSIKDGDLTGASKSLKEVSVAAGEIPNEGGLLAELVGDNTLADFGPQLQAFGPALKDFWLNCKTIKDGDLTGAAKSLKEIATAAGEIPNEGLSVVSVIVGDNTLSTFGPELSAFGPHLKQFATDVSGLEGKESAVTAAATALKQIISAAAEIPNQGLSVVSIFVGDNTLSKFGEELEKFGPHMATFADSIKDIPVTKMLTVAATMPKLVQMAVDAENVSTTILDDFGAALNLFGGNLKDYYDAIADVSTSKIQQVIQTVYRLIEVGNEMATVETGAMADFGSALENVGKTGVDLFISAFEDSHDEAVTAVTNFVQVAEDGVSDFISEFQNQSDAAYQAAAGLVSYAVMGATSNNLDFYYAGENAAYGLVNGFSSVANYAYSVAYAMAVNMANTIRSALRIFSPSRVMYELGDYAGMGLVLGFKDTLPDVESVSEQAANVIIDSVATPLEQLQNVVGDNLDLEPVITPVLDLSNVYDGSSALSGMFSGGTARMSYISSFDSNSIDPILALADRISENATSGDSVINAINEIRSEVTNLGSAITRMKVWLDGQTMVGELIDPLDQAFGERMGFRERGLY